MAIDKATKAHVLEDRLRNLSDCFTAMLYKNVCRSLFEKHKLLFSFLLSVKIMQGEERIDGEELRFFLQGATRLDLVEPNPIANGEGWLTDKTWGEIIAAGNLAAMSGFTENFKSNLSAWESVFVASDPLAEIDEVVGDAFQPFQKLCLLRAFRPDMVIPGVQKFVAQVHAIDSGREYRRCKPSTTNIQIWWKTSQTHEVRNRRHSQHVVVCRRLPKIRTCIPLTFQVTPVYICGCNGRSTHCAFGFTYELFCCSILLLPTQRNY